jgi:hypothetical protein
MDPVIITVAPAAPQAQLEVYPDCPAGPSKSRRRS